MCLLFCNDIAAGRQQAKGQRSAQDVGHSLSHQHTLILEQMYADHQCQQKHHALTADGEQEGRYDFTSCLEQHREQEHHAAKGCGVDLPAEHLRTSGDHPGILHEEPHQRPGIQAEDEG